MKALPLIVNPASSSVIVQHGKTYYLTSSSGKALKKFKVKIVKGKLHVYLDENDGQEPALVVENYQSASFIMPPDAVISGDIEALEIFVRQESFEMGYWLSAGVGSALVSGTVAAIGHSSKTEPSTPVTPAPTPKPATPSKPALDVSKITEAIEALKQAHANHSTAKQTALQNSTLSPSEATHLNELSAQVQTTKQIAQELVNGLGSIGTAEAQTHQQNFQATLDTISVPAIAVSNDSDNDGITDNAEAQAKQALETAIQAAENKLQAYNKAKTDALANGTVSPDEAQAINRLAGEVTTAKQQAQGLINNLSNTIGNTAADQEFARAKQNELNAITASTTTANDTDNDGITDSAETQAKQTLETAIQAAENRLQAYNTTKTNAGTAISPEEASQINRLAGEVATAKQTAQRLIDNLPNTIGNTAADQEFARVKQNELNAISTSTATANDSDNDGITDSAEAQAKQTLDIAFAKLQEKITAYTQAKNSVGKAISQDEAGQLNSLAQAIATEKTAVQRLIDGLQTTIGQTKDDIAYTQEKQTALNQISVPTSVVANDDDNDDISNAMETTAKQALETAIDAAKNKLQTYTTAKTNAGTTISPDEAQAINRLAGEVATAKQQAQRLIDNLPNTIGNTAADQEFARVKQNELNAISTSTATANDSDNDGITDSVEAQAKQAVEAAINAAKTKLQAYNKAKTDALANGTVSPDEAQAINTLANEVSTAKQTAQGLITNLPNTIGDTSGDRAYKTQKQGELEAITADKVIAKPTVQITTIADDGVVTDGEKNNTVNVVVKVGDVGSGSTATISLYDGTKQIITNQTVRNGNNTLTVQGANLTNKTLKAVVTVKNDGLTAHDETSKTYDIDTQTNPITATVNRVAGIGITNGKLSKVIAGADVDKTTNTIPVLVNVQGLEEGGQATINVNVGNKTFTQATTQNGDVTVLVEKTALQTANALTVQTSAQDSYLNPTVFAQEITANYQIDLGTSQPKVEVLSIGEQQQYELYRHQLNTPIPVKIKVSNIDADASAVLTLKTAQAVELTQELTNGNGEYTFNLSGSTLAKANALTVEVVATDINQNTAKDIGIKEYDVENFIIIKEIDADFNISLSDNRMEGTVLSGEVHLSSQITKGYEYLDINSGDLWRWVDSVTFRFEKGAVYTVPVTHIDPDNNGMTADPNVLHYALELTPTEWDALAGQKFSITPNRLKGRDGNELRTVFYSEKLGKIYFENATQDGSVIQTTLIEVHATPNRDIDVLNPATQAGGYDYQITARRLLTTIKGVAGGDDVVAGQKVTIRIGRHTHTTKLADDKTFSIDVPTGDLLTNGSDQVTASIAVQGQFLSTRAAYTHSNMHDATNNTSKHTVTTTGDVAVDDRPYFLQSLFNKDTHNNGFIKDKKAGEAMVIKYSFANPDDAAFVAAMNEHNSTRSERYQYTTGTGFSIANQQAIRDALKLIADRTQITFEEVDGYLEKGEGLNFIMQDMEGNLFGFAQHGYNVHLNAKKFADAITPSNQGISTVIHETLHALGIKHPFDNSLANAKEDADQANVDKSSTCPCGCGSNLAFEKNAITGEEIFALMESSTNSTREATTATKANDLLGDAENRTMLTLMSYTADINEYRDDLRLFDLSALHYLYGVNSNVRPEDNVYTFKAFNKESMDGDTYIWDGAGNDTFNAKTENQKAYINLQPGSWSYVGNKAETFAVEKFSELTVKDFFNNADINLTNPYLNDVFNRLYPNMTMTKGQAFIGYGSVIENAVGTDFDDEIHGNAANNRLEGEAGNDKLYGGDGDDYLSGGTGADLMVGGAGKDIYIVDDVGDVVVEDRLADYIKHTDYDVIYSSVSLNVPKYVEEIRLLGKDNLNIYNDIIVSPNDVITSGAGDTKARMVTKLYGNSGDNHFELNTYNNQVFGNEGKDVFIIHNNEHLNSNYGRPNSIYNFDSDDLIKISSSAFSGILKENLHFIEFPYNGGEVAGFDGYMHYLLQYSIDGNDVPIVYLSYDSKPKENSFHYNIDNTINQIVIL